MNLFAFPALTPLFNTHLNGCHSCHFLALHFPSCLFVSFFFLLHCLSKIYRLTDVIRNVRFGVQCCKCNIVIKIILFVSVVVVVSSCSFSLSHASLNRHMSSYVHAYICISSCIIYITSIIIIIIITIIVIILNVHYTFSLPPSFSLSPCHYFYCLKPIIVWNWNWIFHLEYEVKYY